MPRSRPRPLASSPIQVPPSVKFLLVRVMREILLSFDPITDHERGDIYAVDLEKLRIVIGKGLAISHRMGMSAGRDEMQSRRKL